MALRTTRSAHLELARLLQINAPTEASLANRKHPEAGVQAGERLDDFDLQVLIGEGAFAKVFLAWQRSMQRWRSRARSRRSR